MGCRESRMSRGQAVKHVVLDVEFSMNLPKAAAYVNNLWYDDMERDLDTADHDIQNVNFRPHIHTHKCYFCYKPYLLEQGIEHVL